MTETRAPAAKPVFRLVAVAARRSQPSIGKLEAEGVIQRQGDGFPLDQKPRCLSAIFAARAAAIDAQ